jgi:3-hydroxyacyl-CoA dehydrogenase
LRTEGVAGVDWVQENLPKILEAKRAAFATLDRLAPDGERRS